MGEIKTTGKVAFIGCGAMGEAILKGLLAANMTRKEEISVSLPTAARRDYLAKEYGIKAFSKNAEVVNDADIIILAVKPQMVNTALGEDVVVQQRRTGGERLLDVHHRLERERNLAIAERDPQVGLEFAALLHGAGVRRLWLCGDADVRGAPAAPPAPALPAPWL